MPIQHAFIGAILLISSFAAAQSAESKPEAQVIPRQFPSPIVAHPCPADSGMDPVEVLSDTMGVNFGPYMKGLVATVRESWHAVMPLKVYPPVMKQGQVSIEFSVFKDGSVKEVKLGDSSRDEALDQAAFVSITSSSFLPLPEEFPGAKIKLRFYFYYNLNPKAALTVSPCRDVKVPAGSTQQFFALGKDATDASVTWSVSGEGCSDSACGTITPAGLYTAPAKIPSPPVVTVEAASRRGVIARSVRLTIVESDR